MSSKETAARTAAHHERVTGREAKRLKALATGAAGAKLDGRRRKGLNSAEEKEIVAMLRRGDTWREVERRFGREIEADVLAGWREELERRAGSAPVPRMPDRPKDEAPPPDQG